MKKTIGVGLAILAVVAMTVPAHAQLTGNALPTGFTAVEHAAIAWSAPVTVTALDTFANPYFQADVSWAVIAGSVARPSDYFYFYRISHIGGPNPQPIERMTLNVTKSLVNQVGPLYEFGQYQNAGVGTTSVEALPTGAPELFAWDSRNVPGSGLTTGNSIDLWLVSQWPPAITSLQLIDGGVVTTPVPAPAPEPVSMVLAGMGLAAVAGLRKRSSKI